MRPEIDKMLRTFKEFMRHLVRTQGSGFAIVNVMISCRQLLPIWSKVEVVGLRQRIPEAQAVIEECVVGSSLRSNLQRARRVLL